MRMRHALGRTFVRAGFVFTGAFVAGCGSSAGGSAADVPGEIGTALGAPSEDGGVTTSPGDAGSFSDATAGDDGGPGGPDGGVTGVPSGVWHFDDCSPKSTALVDASGGGANAEHRLKSACVAGISGLGLAINTAKNIDEIPDGPQFTLSDHVAVAAWIKPTKVTGTQPIALKELGSKTSFELSVVSGSVVFSVRLASGKTVTSKAPISANAWSHVGAFYDGHFVFLFLNGQQVGQVDAPGTLANVKAPIRVGASAEGTFFDGVIDELWISTSPVAATDIEALACIARPLTFAVSQAPVGAVDIGTTVSYSVALTNNDVGFCQPDSYFFSSPLSSGGGGVVSQPPGGGGSGPVPIPIPGNGNGTGTGTGTSGPGAGPPPINDAGPPPVDDAGSGLDAGPPLETPLGLSFTVNPPFASNISPGQSFTFDVDVAATVDTDPGDYSLPFQIFGSNGDQVSGALDFQLATPAGCHVTTGRELMVVDATVVDDPVRTSFSGPSTNPSRGVWTFGRLMRDMAPTPAAAPAFTLGLFQSWLTDQTVNGLTVSARPAMQQTVLDGWPRASDGSLDLDQAPLRLLGIVNRIDTRDLAAGNAGESRFVFGVLDAFGNPLQFTVIAEYALLANTEADVLGWANAWHALGALPFPSEQYNAALEALTLKFSGRGVAPSRPNGSALDQLRTNEIALSFQWELRQFGIATTGRFQEETISLTPDLSLNGTSTLAQFINQNQAAILAGTDVLPTQIGGAPFLGGSVFNNLETWNAPGINDGETRFQLSSNTCNGCHGPDTNTTFLQINPRSNGQQAILSGFLTGTSTFDQITGAPRSFNDLARRNQDLASLVCAPAARAQPKAVNGTTIAKGIRRTH